jgi:type I restriction enzyme S subunit
MSFRRVKIESTYEGLYDGPHATPKPSDSGPVFLGIGNITSDGQLDLSDVRHIAEEDYAAWTKRVVPEPGDIVFTYEATLNRYAIIPQGFRGCLGIAS